MASRNPRIPTAAQVAPHGGLGLGMPTTTPLLTRQWTRPQPASYQVLPINWRPEPQLSFRSTPAGGAPAGDGTADCEDCD